MSTFVSNRDAGGLTNENGHFRLPLKVWQGNILDGLKVLQNASPDMTVTITEGDAKIEYNDYSYAVWTDQDTEDIAVDTADTSYDRLDRVVMYVDRGMSFTDTDINNPGALKFKAVAGTPDSSPSLPNDTVVQTSVGVGNPWAELARLEVPANVTDITTARITDTRVSMTSAAITRAMYPIGSIYENAVQPTNPAILFGFGTWEEFGTGRVTVAFDGGSTQFNVIGKQGGEKEVMLGTANLPPHNHPIGNLFMPQGGGSLLLNDRNADGIMVTDNAVDRVNGEWWGGKKYTDGTGSNLPHNNIQPYITIYRWRRTA